MTAAITVGAGKDRPKGIRHVLPTDISLPKALHHALVRLTNGEESWWSPHVFSSDYRLGSNWEASSAVVVDADRIGHAAWDAATREALMSAIVSAEFPGSLTHPTPHGARICFPLAEPSTDRDAWRRAASGACRLVQDALATLPELGLEVDTGASCDLARFFYAPRALVNGAMRDEQVFFLREKAWTLEELAAFAPATSAELKRVESVADEILPNDRHETLKRLAASLRAKGLNADEIYATLREVNERRCKPPKPDSEIRALAEYFDKKNGADLIKGGLPDPTRFSSIAVRMPDFLKLHIEKPIGILGGVFSAGDVGALVGRGGVGKSWFGLMLGRGIARGESCFGLATPEGGVKVGILELEDHAYHYQQRLSAIAEASGGCDERDGNLEIVTRPDLQGAVRVADQDTMAALVDWIERSELKVLIVDALKDAHVFDENNNQQMAIVMEALKLVANLTGCAIILLAHEPKPTSNGSERDDVASIRGASRIGDDCRYILRLVSHKSGLRKLVFAKVSHGAPQAPVWLAQDKETGVFTVAEAPEAVKNRNEDKVRDALRESGRNGLTLAALKEETRLSKSTIHDRLKALHAESNGGNPPRYRLPSGASESDGPDAGTPSHSNSLEDSEPSASESDWNLPSGVRTVRPKGRTGRTDARSDSVRPDEQPNIPFSASGNR